MSTEADRCRVYEMKEPRRWRRGLRSEKANTVQQIFGELVVSCVGELRCNDNIAMCCKVSKQGEVIAGLHREPMTKCDDGVQPVDGIYLRFAPFNKRRIVDATAQRTTAALECLLRPAGLAWTGILWLCDAAADDEKQPYGGKNDRSHVRASVVID